MPPCYVRRVETQYNKADRLWFWRADVQENSGGTPEARSRLCVLSGFLPHDLCHGWDSSRWLPAATYRCESRTIKKTEHQRIDAFELWYWRRLLRVPWTARRSNQIVPGGSDGKASMTETVMTMRTFIIWVMCMPKIYWNREERFPNEKDLKAHCESDPKSINFVKNR